MARHAVLASIIQQIFAPRLQVVRRPRRELKSKQWTCNFLPSTSDANSKINFMMMMMISHSYENDPAKLQFYYCCVGYDFSSCTPLRLSLNVCELKREIWRDELSFSSRCTLCEIEETIAKLVREDYTQRDRAQVQRHHSSTMRSNIAAKHSARSIKVRSTMSRDSFNPCKVRIYSMRSRPRHRRESETQWPQLSAHKWQMVAIMHFFNTFIVGSSQQSVVAHNEKFYRLPSP